MRVWIQNPFDNLPEEGYRKQRYRLMADAFMRAGHTVVYFTSDFSHATKEPRQFRAAPAESPRLVLIPTPPYRRNVSLARVLSHRAYARAWMKLADGEKASAGRPDLIVSSIPTISGAEAALALGRRFGARVAIDIQDAWPETFERLAPRPLRALARAFLAPLRARARRIYAAADVVTGVSRRYRELSGRADFHLAYHGIDCSLPARPPRTPDGVIRLVYAGNLGRTYDLRTVVRAVEANPDFELDVAGFGSFSSSCARVHFRGYLNEDDLRQLFASADIGVIPMAAESWVGVPYKFCDYARAGLSIVSSLGGESAELLDRMGCGATYRAGDVASLADAIRRAHTLVRGASRQMCDELFDATKIYDAYVQKVTHD